MPGTSGISRRSLFAGSAAGTAAALLPTAAATAAPKPKHGATAKSRTKSAASGASYRAAYHFTVPDQWKNDPQRPVWIDGEYHYYYLYNADYFSGVVGTAWRLATTKDLVSFTDRGVAVPKDTTPNGDLWSGSAVVDTGNTAGFGAGAVVVIVTMSPGGGTDHQEQFLYYSTDGGLTFTNYGADPVLANPGVADFRDPKVIRDEERGRWVMALAENDKIGFYHSDDLKSWTYVSGFVHMHRRPGVPRPVPHHRLRRHREVGARRERQREELGAAQHVRLLDGFLRRQRVHR